MAVRRKPPDAREGGAPGSLPIDPGSAKVSVVVPVRDDVQGVQNVIGHLAGQTLPQERFEMVIGGDGLAVGSIDGLETADGCIRVVTGPPETSYAARNRAASASTAEVLAFCDSDCLPEPGWLEEGLAALEDADIVAGEVRFVAPPEPTLWSLLTIDMFLDQERNALLSRAVTANLLVRRELFEELGGFDVSLPSGGDYDFVKRATDQGARLAYAPRAVVRHPTLDGRRAFLGKVRQTNWWSGVRRARDGDAPELVGVLTFVPGLGVALARRRALRPAFRLERTRLVSSGVEPRRWDVLRALVALYFVVGYVAGFARLRGWLEGRKLARGDAAATGARG